MMATEAGAIHLARCSLEESKSGKTTDVSASFEIQSNNLFSRVVVKLIGKKLLGSTREALKNDLSDLDNVDPVT